MRRTTAVEARGIALILLPLLALVSTLLFWSTRDVAPAVSLGQGGTAQPEAPTGPAAKEALPAPPEAPSLPIPPAVDQASADRLASALAQSLPPGFATDEAGVHTGPDGVLAIGANFRHPSGTLISVLTVVPGPEGVAATVAAAKGSGAREVALPGGAQGFLTSAGKYPDEWHNQLLVVDGHTTIVTVTSVGTGAGKGAPPLNDVQLSEFAGRAVEASGL